MKRAEKFMCILLAIVISFSLLCSCDVKQLPPDISTNSNTRLIDCLTLSLPIDITRKHSSPLCDYFFKNDQIVGGIEIIEKPGQRDSTPNEMEYVEIAADVTRSVQNGEYDYSVAIGGAANLIVDIAFPDNQTFMHYFFFGETVIYDIWVDFNVLNTQEMNSILKTLRSEDIINPQDNISVNAEVPILDLRMALPSGIIQMPSTTSQLLFYSSPSSEQYVTGENIVGGIIALKDAVDLGAIEVAVTDSALEYLGNKYKTTSENYKGTKVFAKITANSEENNLVAFVAQVDNQPYAVWAITSIVPEIEILKIAESLCF